MLLYSYMEYMQKLFLQYLSLVILLFVAAFSISQIAFSTAQDFHSVQRSLTTRFV